MAITKTKIKGPAHIAKLGNQMTFELAIGATGWLAAGNAVDLSDWFSEISSAVVGADSEVISGYKFGMIIPGDGVAVTTTNCLLTAHYSTDAAGAMTAVPNDTDLSGITGLRLTVTGKPAADKY